ncbi:MAG: hypothetical protein K2L86_16855 [Lachnospiraceae bacterium]|nr:hypothetical protein [Lachnospiraceae bacterium]
MRKLKQLLAAALAVSIVLNTPACMVTAAARQTQMRRRIPRPADIITIQEPSEETPAETDEPGWEEDSERNADDCSGRYAAEDTESSLAADSTEDTESSLAADSTEDTESSLAADSTEDTESSSSVNPTEDIENRIEVLPEEPTEESSQTTPEEVSEDAAAENPTEGPMEENTENDAEDDTEEDTGDDNGGFPENSTEELSEDTTEPDTAVDEEIQRPVQIILEVTDAGRLDYRTYMEAEDFPKLSVRLEECAEDTEFIEVSELQRADSGQAALEDEMPEIHYFLKLEEDSVVAPLYSEEACVYDADKACFRDTVALEVLRVGETVYTVEALGGSDREVYPGTGIIKVYNSPMLDSDFYIEVIRGETKQNYTYREWAAYLKAHNNWVDGEVRLQLSDAGSKYYTKIVSEELPSAGRMKTCTFWAENPKRNASTKEEENGTRSYTVGIDKEAPVLTALKTDKACFELASTDTVWYFAEDFVLTGAFEDMQSGLGRIEYTTQATVGEGAVWTTVDAAADGTFRIVLSDGCYDAIAVRAYDLLGNASKTHGFVNDKGEYIKVVVDRAAPVLKLDVTADGEPYCGDKDNWTNKDILFTVTADAESCPYAGIGQLEYKYEKIGERSDDVDSAGEWTALPWQEGLKAALNVTNDANGYYYFRVQSKSGVLSACTARERVLVQHEAAELKPLILTGVDETKRRNEWYNKESGTPYIRFEFPEYDTGAVSKEYDAPITMHYRLSAQGKQSSSIEKSVSMGVTETSGKLVLTEESLEEFAVDFGYRADTQEARDGIYTLEYWTTDKAGNQSKRQKQVYKIDTHEPTGIKVTIDGSEFAVGKEQTIVYTNFYRSGVTGRARAQYGISGKGSLQIKRAKKPGEWNDRTGFDGEDTVDIPLNTRCFLYVRAQDYAGNVAEGWTMGIVTDNMAPDGADNVSLIMAPEGANENGFFSQDVGIRIQVRENAGSGDCSALRYVTSSVGRDGVDTIADRMLFSFTKECPTDEELSGAAAFQTVQVVNAQENESNDAYIEVTAADRAGNTRTSIRMLKIDVTKPVLSVEFDNRDAPNDSYYRRPRTAAIRVTERNFDPAAVNISIQKDGKPFAYQMPRWTSDGIEHYAEIVFEEDGRYVMEAVCTDLAGNVSNKVQMKPFIIDRTAPEIQVSLTSPQEKASADQAFFHTEVTAVITVRERHFQEEAFVLNSTAQTRAGQWKHDGDMHMIQVVYDKEGAHHIDCAYTDMAGNTARRAARDFIIDRTAPVITMKGVADGSANRGEILPVVTVLDAHLELQEVSIAVREGTGVPVENVIETVVVDDGTNTGYRFTLKDMTDKEDNVYYLTVTAVDKAGNEAARTCRFSLNRKGSVYDMTHVAALMQNQYQTKEKMNDLEIVEMNVDMVEEFDLYISKNGELGTKAIFVKEISGSESTGYTYVYKIDKTNFTEEGAYRLSLYSKDRAGNEINNASDIHGKEITFIVDNTAPKVIIDGTASANGNGAGPRELQIVVTDNFSLAEAEFMIVNNENDVLEYWDYMALAGEGETMSITLAPYDEEVALVYRVRDAAGNEAQRRFDKQTVEDVRMAGKDSVTQYYDSLTYIPYGGILAVLAALVGLGLVLIVWWHRENSGEERGGRKHL